MGASVQPAPFDPDAALAAVGGPQPTTAPSSTFDPDAALAAVQGGGNPDAVPQQGPRFFSPASKELGHVIASIPAGVVGTPAAVGGLIEKYAPTIPGVAQLGEGASWLGQKLAPVTQGLQGIADQIAPAANRAGMSPSQEAALDAVDVIGSFAPSIVGAGISAGATAAGKLPIASAVMQALHKGADAGELAQSLDQDMAASKAAADPLWDKVRAENLPVGGPAIDRLMQTPDAPKAWAAADEYARNHGEPSLGAFPKPPKQAISAALERALGVPATPDLVDHLIATNPQLGQTGAVPTMGLQYLKEYLDQVVRDGGDEVHDFASSNAKALGHTVGQAIQEARAQNPTYGSALDASAQHLSLVDARLALNDMMSPRQQIVAAVANPNVKRALPAGAVQAFDQAATGAARPAIGKAGGAAAATAMGHPYLGVGMGLGAARDIGSAFAAGGRSLSGADVATLLQKAGPVGSARLLPLLSRAAAATKPAVGAPTLLQALQAAAAVRQFAPQNATGGAGATP